MKELHFRVEYDKVGKFIYIPLDLIDVHGSEKKAFEKVTGINKSHIISYTSWGEDYYDEKGNVIG